MISKKKKKEKKKDLTVDPWCLAVEPAPGDGVRLAPCDVFLVGGPCACILSVGAGPCLLRAVQCTVIGFGVSMGSACLRGVLLALAVLDVSISAAS